MGKNAFTQTAIGDAQALGGKLRSDRLENGAAGEDEIGALAPDAALVCGPVQVQLALPIDVPGWLRDPAADLPAAAPLDVVAYIAAPDASPEIEVLTPAGRQLLAAAATPHPRDELLGLVPDAGPTVASWLERGILVGAR